MSAPEPYRSFSAFEFDRPQPGVLRLWIDTGAPNNGVTIDNHREFVDVWRAVASEDDVRAVVVRGVNGVFCGGGDPGFLRPLLDSPQDRLTVYEDIRALVLNLLDCPKPVVSAIEGFCSGAGLAVGLMADIPVAARSASLLDSHILAGLASGDHAAFAWPLLMGMARSKYHLLTATALTGELAERYGLVAQCVDDAELHERALEVAARLASLPPEAVSLTKRALNGWFRLAQPVFEQSAALETLGFAGDAARAVVKAWENRDSTAHPLTR
jgi:enoyl-CoA hydratase